jgi:hypothetical protein
MTEHVARIGQATPIDGQATAPDALGEIVTEVLELGDALVQVRPPLHREPGPVAAAGGAAITQAAQGLADLAQRDPHPLGGSNERHPTKDITLVAALIAGRSPTGDEAAGLVEMKGRNRHTAPRRDLADGELLALGRKTWHRR